MSSLTIVSDDAGIETPEYRMALQLQSAALFGFAALTLIAAFEDLRRLIIPNALTLSLCLLWPCYVAATPGLMTIAGSLGCGLAVFLAGALCFSRGYLGGGDVKLLAAAALWAGPAGTVPLLVLTGVLGGMLALLLLLPPGAYIASAARAKLGPAELPAKFGTATPVPYGIAIAAAAMLVIFVPHFR
jgi:prepilin peptidase CpaA